jgi:hypothetical protein
MSSRQSRINYFAETRCVSQTKVATPEPTLVLVSGALEDAAQEAVQDDVVDTLDNQPEPRKVFELTQFIEALCVRTNWTL